MRHPGTTAALLGGLLATACGPDRLLEAELEPICGQPGPAQLLELDADRPPVIVGQRALVDDRRILDLRFRDEEPDPAYLLWDTAEIWSIGRCGEDPKRLREGDARLSFLQYPDVWPDLLLVCDADSGQMTTLDPHGTRPPNLVFTLPDCRGFQTPHGIVTLDPRDDDRGALTLQPWPDDPWTQTSTPRVLVDDVRLRADPPHENPQLFEVAFAAGDVAFAVTGAHELVHVPLPDGEVTVEASDVRELAASPSGRFVGWRTTDDTHDDPQYPGGSVYVRDREDGRTEHLTDDALTSISSCLHDADDGVIHQQLGSPSRGAERFWLWPSLRTHDLAPGRGAVGRLADGRFLVTARTGGPFELLDVATGELQPLFPDEGDFRYREDGIEVLEGSGYSGGNDVDRIERELWLVPLEGEPRMLAPHVTRSYQLLADETVITTIDVDPDRLGTLVAVGPDTHVERAIDRRVVVSTYWSIDPDDHIVYGVVDDDRTGVWLAALAD